MLCYDLPCCYKYMPMAFYCVAGGSRADALYIEHAGESKIKGDPQQAPRAEQGRPSEARGLKAGGGDLL